MTESQKVSIFQHKFFQHKLFKVTVVVLAVLMGGLLVSGVVGYFTLMEKIEAGTLEEVAERLPEDTQTLVVFRGLGELGRDFLDVLGAMPEDREKIEKIEDEYGIDLGSPWDLYETGIDPFRPLAVGVMHLDVRLVTPEPVDGEDPVDLRQPHWNPSRSVVVVMIPVHDEQDAFLFASDLIPKLGLGDGAMSAAEQDLGRETAQAVSFGERTAIGVEAGYMFYVHSGDPSFKAADELERVMAIDPAVSLWTSKEFTQQRSLADDDWNVMAWSAPAFGEKALTRTMREFISSAHQSVVSLLGKKVELETINMGSVSTVAHLTPELGRMRTILDLSPTLGADTVTVGSDQHSESVGNSGIFPLVSGTPLAAMRLTLDTNYLWKDWLSQDAEVQNGLQMMPPTLESSVLENLTGNITLAVMARDNPLGWTPNGSLSDLHGLVQGTEAMPFPVEMVMGIEFKDTKLLIPELENWSMPCVEPEEEGGIWWCDSDESMAVGITDTHLIYAFGVGRQQEIDAVNSGMASSFMETVSERQVQSLELGPDVHGLLWVENLARQVDQTYFNSHIVRWFQITGEEEAVKGQTTPVQEILAHPPAPEALAAELDQAVDPILKALSAEADRSAREAEELNSRKEELEAEYLKQTAAYEAAVVSARVDNPEAPQLTKPPAYVALEASLDDVSDRAYKVDLRSKVLLRSHDDLVGYIAVIKKQAQVRATLVAVAEHVAYLSVGVQFWEDAAMVLDLQIHPKDGDFVSGLLQTVRQEVVSQ